MKKSYKLQQTDAQRVMIKISGINKFSMVNYPGKIACVLFAKGCPLKCKYCYNKVLLREPTIEEDYIKEFLEERKGLLDGVVFSGGEPMMQYRELLETTKYVKSLGYKIGIHITGLNSDKPEFKEIIQLCDWIGLDFKAPEYKYKRVCGLDYKYFLDALNLILEEGKDFEIRTTLDKLLTKEDLLEMEKVLLNKKIKKWFIQHRMLNEGEFAIPDFNLDNFNIQTEFR